MFTNKGIFFTTASNAEMLITGSDGNFIARKAASLAGKWEIDPDDGKSIQFKVPSQSFGGSNDRIGFYISASGHIGIGTKDPESAFDVRDVKEDIDPKRSDLKTKIFNVTKRSQQFDVPITGSIVSASRGFIGNLTGNADTATQLATARTIGGTSFNGSANIAVNLAATATALATARTIGGVSFDGSANINLPGVNTTGNQDTTGTATNATNVTVTSDIGAANHPLIFIDDTSPDGSVEGLKAASSVHVNPNTGTLTLGGLTISYTQGDGRSTFGTVTFSGIDANKQDRSVTINMS